MRIGIDAKWYFTGPVSTQVVLKNLLPELFSQYPEHEWVIFLDQNDKTLDFPFPQKNVFPHYVWANNNMLSNVFVLPGSMKKFKVDVMLFQTFPAMQRRIPSIAFIHDVLFRDFPQFFTWKERLYFLPLAPLTRRARRLVATTEYVAGRLVKYRYSSSRSAIDLVPLGVNPGYRPKASHDPGLLAGVKQKFRLPERYILYVGRLNVRKNIENLLKALPLLQDKNIPLVIVGKEDWKAPGLERVIADAGIGQRIVMTGGVTDEELVAIYALATLFCFPSFAEGFGLPPLEAMASGVPVIVSGTTALPDVCGDAAVYVDPSSPESIAAAVNSLLGNPEQYNRQSVAGLERVELFSWKKTAQAIMQSIINAAKTPS